MNERPAVTIFLPAYNEAATLPAIIETLLNSYRDDPTTEILVVDDGSLDQTADVVRRYPEVRLVCHPYNNGHGAAVKTALLVARTPYMMVMDADGQHNPEDLERLRGYLADYDLVVGARTSVSATTPMHHLGNQVLAGLASYLVSHPIPDLLCGLRAFDVGLMKQFINIIPDHFNFEATSTLSFLASGYYVRFEPVRTWPRQGGASKIRPWRDGMRFLGVLLRLIMLFNPLRVFVPISALLASMGLAWGSYSLIRQHQGLSVGALLFFVTAMVVMLIGLSSDQIAQLRRELGKAVYGNPSPMRHRERINDR